METPSCRSAPHDCGATGQYGRVTRPAHVVVYASAGSDANYFGKRGKAAVVLRASARILVAIALFALMLTWVANGVGGGGVALLVTLVVFVGLGVASSAVLRVQQRRYRAESGFRWAARYATYLGPFDEATGIHGSLSFATTNLPKVTKPPIVWLATRVYRWTKRRRLGSEPAGALTASREAASPPRGRRRTLNVRLVLTGHAFLAVPRDELNTSLRLPLNRTTIIGVTQSRIFGALSFEMLDGRKAHFRVQPDSTLIDELAALGCTIEHRR